MNVPRNTLDGDTYMEAALRSVGVVSGRREVDTAAQRFQVHIDPPAGWKQHPQVTGDTPSSEGIAFENSDVHIARSRFHLEPADGSIEGDVA